MVRRNLQLFARENKLPVTMTLQGLGAFPGTDEQSLGMLGMHGTYWANQAVDNCDVLVSLGARFDDRVTGNVETFAKNAYKIHVDIDPTCIDKNVIVDIPIVGDVKHVLAELLLRCQNLLILTIGGIRYMNGKMNVRCIMKIMTAD